MMVNLNQIQVEWAYYGSTSRSTCPDLDDNTQVSSDTVTTYVRTPISLSSYILLQYGDEQLKIRGGWNRTDMSTQDGDTMLATPNNNTDGIVVSALKACYLENFYVHGGRYGIYVYNVATLHRSCKLSCWLYFKLVNLCL